MFIVSNRIPVFKTITDPIQICCVPLPVFCKHNRHGKKFCSPFVRRKKKDQYIKIPFETFSSWVVMPATAAGDPVNSGIGIGTGRNERKLGCLEKDPPMGHSWRWTGSCRAVRMSSQVEPGVAQCSPLPGSSCHAVMPHPGERATKQLKLVGTLIYSVLKEIF